MASAAVLKSVQEPQWQTEPRSADEEEAVLFLKGYVIPAEFVHQTPEPLVDPRWLDLAAKRG
jgi:hypothetical protein